MSAAYATAFTPYVVDNSRASASASVVRRRKPIAIWALCSAKSRDGAAPIPRERPVMSARLPSSPIIVLHVLQFVFDELADQVFDAQVQLLRAVGAIRWDDDGEIGQRAQLAAVARTERQH